MSNHEPNQHIMVDLETMGTRPGSAIVAIGAVMFTETDILREFYRVVDLESCQAVGLHIDAATVMWWLRRDDQARSELGKDAVTLPRALLDFSEWIGQPGFHYVWGNGAAFDNALLAEAYHRCQLQLPWKYKHDRCYRTMAAAFPHVPRPPGPPRHIAHLDARDQAHHLMAIWRDGMGF